MAARLVIGVLGKRNAGKSTTWTAMFGSEVRTGKKTRRLTLRPKESVEVFVVNGSPQERDIFIGNILPTPPDELPTIVLCSLQYRPDVRQTFDFFVDNGFDLRIVWLNPGWIDKPYADDAELVPYLLDKGAWIVKRDATESLNVRGADIREMLYGWCWPRGLLHLDP